MITVSRLLAQQSALLIRRLLQLRGRMANDHPVQFLASREGFLICSCSARFAVQYHDPAAQAPASAVVPLGLLRRAGSPGLDSLTIEQTAGGPATLRWQDGAIPREISGTANEALSREFPAPASGWVPNGGGFLKAFKDACDTTDASSSRYALGCVQFRGKEGAIAATDGRQLLLQRGFQFGFEESVLVPAMPAIDCLAVSSEARIEFGKTSDHFVLRSGRWTVWLTLEKEARFPRIDDVIPVERFARTHLELDPADQVFLREHLKRLPGWELHDAPVTIELNNTVAIRAKREEDTAVAELVLSNSTKTGDDICLATNRSFLSRALKLGFSDYYFGDARSPVLCQDERRKYVWAVLEQRSSTPGGGHVSSIESPPGCADRPMRRRRGRSQSLPVPAVA